MAVFVPVAREEDIVEGSAQAYEVNGEEIALVRCDGQIYAIDNVCTHSYAQLSEGEVDTDECIIECPLHGARFDLATGRVRALPATVPARTFSVRVVEGHIEVAIES